MRPVSQRWLDAVRGSHKPVFEVRACVPYSTAPVNGGFFYPTGVDPAGTVIPIEGGDITWDVDSDIMATLNLTVADDTFYPDKPTDLLAPYGNELFVRRGIDYGGGSVEWVSLGYYRINSVEQGDARGGSFRLTASDRMWRIARHPVGGYQFDPSTPSPTNTNGWAVRYLAGVYGFYLPSGTPPIYELPNIPIEWDSPAVRDATIARQLTVIDERWAGLDEFVRSLDKVMFFDYRGIMVIRTPPSTSTPPVWTVDSGRNGVLVSLGRSSSDEGVANYVKVVGDDVWTDWRDTDPASPTYYQGKFGELSTKVNDDQLVTVGQVEALAKRELARRLTLPYAVDLGAVPNAALEPYDVVRVLVPGEVDETHVIRRLTIPLSASAPVTAETQRIA